MNRTRNSTQVFSVFHQIESAAAEAMIEKHRLYKIQAHEIPESAAVNEHGEPALFAFVCPAELVREFEDTIINLRA